VNENVQNETTLPPALAFLGKIDLKQAKKRADKGD
jgi:hypothetical protein